MRTIFRNLLLIALLCVGNIAFSQDYVFRVLANKGENQVKRATGSTEGLKTGATLKTGDQIIASSRAYIGLMHRTGKTLEIRESGVIKVNDLEKKVASAKTSVTSRYAQYVMNKINEKDGGIRNNYRASMSATGAVSRAVGEESIQLVLPLEENKVEVYNPEVIIRWQEVKSDAEEPVYIVSVKNIFNEELYMEETGKSSITLNLDDDKMKNESNNLYIVNVTLKSDAEEKITSKDYAIKRVNLEENAQLKSDLEGLISEIDTESAMGKIVLATFYDENRLVLDALTQYEKVVSENPGVTDFKELYAEFLSKNKMVTGEVAEEGK